MGHTDSIAYNSTGSLTRDTSICWRQSDRP